MTLSQYLKCRLESFRLDLQSNCDLHTIPSVYNLSTTQIVMKLILSGIKGE